LGLEERKPEWKDWRKFIDLFENPRFHVKIGLVGKYVGLVDSYISMNEALRHAGAACEAKVSIDYIAAEKFEKDPTKLEVLKNYDGVFVPYGFGPRGTEGKMQAIHFARENNMPLDTSNPVINLMPEQKDIGYKGATMRLGAHKVMITSGTLAHKLYKAEEIYQRHRHRLEVNPDYWEVLEKHGLVFSGKSPNGRRMEILELPDRFFFLASQFHGEFKSRPGKPDPEYYGFVRACLDRELGKAKPEF